MQGITPGWTVYDYKTLPPQPPDRRDSPFSPRHKMLSYQHRRRSWVDLPEDHRHLGLADLRPQTITKACTYRRALAILGKPRLIRQVLGGRGYQLVLPVSQLPQELYVTERLPSAIIWWSRFALVDEKTSVPRQPALRLACASAPR